MVSPLLAAKGAFPSPCGEEVSATQKEELPTIFTVYQVSVPLRGRGKCDIICLEKVNDNFILFPSPCGEEVSATLVCSDSRSAAEKFPSPCGEEVSATHR